jgi:hypothetical protein
MPAAKTVSATKEVEQPTKTVQKQDVPLSAHHAVLWIGASTSPDTRIDPETGKVLSPGSSITSDQAGQWIRDIYLTKGWSVLNVIPQPLQGASIPMLILLSTEPQERTQVDFRLMVRPAIGPNNVMEADNQVGAYLKAGYEWQADKTKMVTGIGGGMNVCHWFVKYA